MNDDAAANRSAPHSDPCPPVDELADYLAGRVSDERIEQIALHCENCPRCLELLRQLNDFSDANIRRARTVLFDLYGKDEFRQLLKRLDGKFGFGLSRAWDQQDRSHGSAPLPDCGDLRVPERLGQYELLNVVGQGGMGVVYRARHVSLKSERALKILRPQNVTDIRELKRFYQEIEAIGRLERHSNVVAAYDAAEAQGIHYLVMELVDGWNLASLLTKTGPLGIADACEICRQAAVGLDYAYEHHIVHRDVKPSNLLLSQDGEVKVTDLGLAWLAADAVGKTNNGEDEILGTSDYMAPEQWDGSAVIDTRADIYSLGCTLFQLLTGVAPYREISVRGRQKADAHRRAAIPSLRERRRDVPVELQAAVEKMLAKRPGDRFSRPMEVAEAMRRFSGPSRLGKLAANLTSGKADTACGSAEPTSITGDAERASLRWSRRKLVIAFAISAAAGSLASATWRPWRTPDWIELPVGKNVPRPMSNQAAPDFRSRSGRGGVVSSRGRSLLWMGEATSVPYELKADFSLRGTATRAGVFWAFRHGVQADGSGFIYQMLELEKIDADGYRLNWSEASAQSAHRNREPVTWIVAPGDRLLRLERLEKVGIRLTFFVDEHGVQYADADGERVLDRRGFSDFKMPRARNFVGPCGLFVEDGSMSFSGLWIKAG